MGRRRSADVHGAVIPKLCFRRATVWRTFTRPSARSSPVRCADRFAKLFSTQFLAQPAIDSTGRDPPASDSAPRPRALRATEEFRAAYKLDYNEEIGIDEARDMAEPTRRAVQATTTTTADLRREWMSLR